LTEETKTDIQKLEGRPTGKTWNFVKRLVSTNKLRYTRDGFDLDLSYIRPNVIAMGFPSTGVSSCYRNSLNDTRNFLDQKHPGHYKVYNLCIEKDKKYDAALFPNGKMNDEF